MRELNDPSILFLESRLKFRHLRLLVALDEHRNIVRAAESMKLSQPGASKLLADMEKVLGARLFERQPRGLEPNELGVIFIRRARVILSELKIAGSEFLELKSGHSGAVNVGAFSAPGLELIASALKSVRSKNSQIQLWVDVGNTEYLLKRLSDGALDFAIGWVTPEMDPDIFAIDVISREKFHFICRIDHPLMAKEKVQLEDLVGADWLLQSPDSLARRATEALFAANGLPIPEPMITTTSFLSMLVLLRESDAVSVASTAAIRLFASMGGFAVLPMSETLASEPLAVVCRAETELKPTARLFLNAVKSAIQEPPELAVSG